MDVVHALAQQRRYQQHEYPHPDTEPHQELEQLCVRRERLRQLGVESIAFNPCGNLPKAGDFLSVMVENAASLEQVYE